VTQQSNNDEIFELLLVDERLRKGDPRVTRLLTLTGSKREEWRWYGELFLGHQSPLALKQLGYLQEDLIKIVTDRGVEVDVLHKRVRRHKKANKINAKINGRWKQLDNLVKIYNTEIRKVSDANLSQLSATDI
jgi:hypothetical protein